MRLYQHLFYAIAALIGVTLIAMKDPSVTVAMAAVGDQAAVCRDDHLERPCNPRLQVADLMQDGRVIAR